MLDLSTFFTSNCSSDDECLVVPLIAAIGFGMFVPTDANCCGFGCCNCDAKLVFVVSGLRPTGTCNLACGILCIFVGGELSAPIPLFSVLSFLSPFAAFLAGAGTFDEAFVDAEALAVSDFFERLFVLDVDVVCDDGMLESLFKLMLESLRSLRAEEKPLLELVRFDSCVFGISVLSLPKSFSLPSIDCLTGVCCCCCRFPFVSSDPLFWVYGLVGILQFDLKIKKNLNY